MKKIEKCDTSWSSVAKNVYEDSILMKEVSR